MLKWRISSLLGLANVTFRVLAFAAQAIFNNLKISDERYILLLAKNFIQSYTCDNDTINYRLTSVDPAFFLFLSQLQRLLKIPS